MTVHDLNSDQLSQLKQNMLCERMDAHGESPSWGELADADNIISDAEVKDQYSGVDFVPDDFSC